MSNKKFEMCSEFVENYLKQQADKGAKVMKLNVMEPDTRYLMCRQYMEGYNAGQAECMELVAKLQDRIQQLENQSNLI